MRDPDRIPGYCRRFVSAWKRKSDLDFLDFIYYVANAYGRDIFSTEDEELIYFIENLVANTVSDSVVMRQYDVVESVMIDIWHNHPDDRLGQMLFNYIADILYCIRGVKCDEDV